MSGPLNPIRVGMSDPPPRRDIDMWAWHFCPGCGYRWRNMPRPGKSYSEFCSWCEAGMTPGVSDACPP